MLTRKQRWSLWWSDFKGSGDFWCSLLGLVWGLVWLTFYVYSAVRWP